MNKQNKTIGIIGGMGPFASAYFYKLLLKKSSDNHGAKNNDDFPDILIDSVPVPDFISNTKNLNIAREMLIQKVKKMNRYGVDNISMICNTGHILYDDLARSSKSDFYSMIDLVAKEVSKRKYRKVGVLATPTTIKHDLYGESLKNGKVKVFYPSIELQALHERIIRNMVEGNVNQTDREKLNLSTKKFINEYNLDAVVLGCTELPLVFPKNKFTNVIDCMDVLADKLLEKYYN